MDWLTVPQAAEQMGVSRKTVLSWIDGGGLKAINVSPHGSRQRRFRIPRAAFTAFIASRAANNQAAGDLLASPKVRNYF